MTCLVNYMSKYISAIVLLILTYMILYNIALFNRFVDFYMSEILSFVDFKPSDCMMLLKVLNTKDLLLNLMLLEKFENI